MPSANAADVVCRLPFTSQWQSWPRSVKETLPHMQSVVLLKVDECHFHADLALFFAGYWHLADCPHPQCLTRVTVALDQHHLASRETSSVRAHLELRNRCSQLMKSCQADKHDG